MNLLYTNTAGIQVFRIAFRTVTWFGRFITAVMTFQFIGKLMLSHNNMAGGAGGNVSTGVTLHNVSVATAVVMDHHLIFLLKVLSSLVQNMLGKVAAYFRSLLCLFEIDKFKRRQTHF